MENNFDEDPKNKFEDMLRTPYEKILKILGDIKKYLSSLDTKESQYHLENLNWVISRLLSSSLYTYDVFQQSGDIFEKYDTDKPELTHLLNYIEENEEFPSKKELKYKKEFTGDLSSKENILTIDLTKNTTNYYRKENSKAPSLFFNKEKLSFTNSSESKEFTGENLDNEKSIKGKNSSGSLTAESQNNKVQINIYQSNDSSNSNSSNEESASNELNKEIKEELHENSVKFENIPQRKRPLLQDSFALKRINKFKANSSKNVLSFRYKENNFIPINTTKILAENNYIPEDILAKDFDIFTFKSKYGYEQVMPIIGKVLFEHFGLNEIVEWSKFDNFINSISCCYIKDVLYHNAIHGTDVTHTTALCIIHSNFAEKLNCTKKDILALITSCLGHDIGHPGLNNGYLMNSFSEIAVNYNDISILENFHSANLFRIIKEKQNNIFEKLSQFDFKTLRKRIVSQILATDMAIHGKVLAKIKTIVDSGINIGFDKNEKNLIEKQQEYFDFVVHAADIAHNAKKFEYSIQFVELLSEEFWRQGDKERKNNMQISFLCDRNDFNIPKSQVGFIKAFIIPTFETMISVFPSLDFFLDNAKKNLGIWAKYVEEKRKTGFRNEIQ